MHLLRHKLKTLELAFIIKNYCVNHHYRHEKEKKKEDLKTYFLIMPPKRKTPAKRASRKTTTTAKSKATPRRNSPARKRRTKRPPTPRKRQSTPSAATAAALQLPPDLPPRNASAARFNYFPYDKISTCIDSIIKMFSFHRPMSIRPVQTVEIMNCIKWYQLNYPAYDPHMLYSLHYEANSAIFDIDDTIIKSPPEDKDPGFVVNPKLVDSTVSKMYGYLCGIGWKIFFITARTEHPKIRKWTEDQLDFLGFDKRDGLFLMPENTNLGTDNSNFSYYKYLTRRRLKAAGCVIGINIGDSFNDLLITPPWNYNAYTAKDPNNMNLIQDFIFNSSKIDNHTSRKVKKKITIAEAMDDTFAIIGLEDAVVSIKLPQD